MSAAKSPALRSTPGPDGCRCPVVRFAVDVVMGFVVMDTACPVLLAPAIRLHPHLRACAAPCCGGGAPSALATPTTPLAFRGSAAMLDGMTASELAPPRRDVTSGERRSHPDAREAWTPRTVVVGFEGSPAASRAVERAVALMDGSGLLILVTVDPAVYSRGMLSESLLEPDEDLAVESLRQARARLRNARVAQLTLVRRGNPTEVLVDVAREYSAQLVVVGRRGRDFAARALLGSVATQVVANAPCDVLVVS